MYSVTTAKSIAHAHLVASKGSLRAAPREIEDRSYANVRDVSFQHLHWVFGLDFTAQQVRGSAEYTFTYIADDATAAETAPPVVVLDTRGLGIERVYVDGRLAPFELQDARNPTFGRALVVPVAAHAKKLRVVYATLPDDRTCAFKSALQWLPRELTADKTHPFLYTQCERLHARTLVPVPDTPAAKFTYTAVVTAPEWATVLLSAIADITSKHRRHAAAPVAVGTRVVAFRQDHPIASYLLGIVAGRLESAELGPRSRVWAEPSVVARAAHEFARTEAVLSHAEGMTDQLYAWTRFDLVCLPPSFPFDTLATPSLTCVTPTVLAGDRTLAAVVVAYAIAQSWAGHGVTPHAWRDEWLTESWTLWLARTLYARVLNDPRLYDVQGQLGLNDLRADTLLVSDVDSVASNDSDSVVRASIASSEKGFHLLHYLRTIVGGPTVFEPFVQHYLRTFRFQPLTTEAFRACFESYFTETVDKHAAIAQIDWQTWLSAPGMPPVVSSFDTTLSSQATELAEHMVARPDDPTTWTTSVGTSATTLTAWPLPLWLLLLDTLLVLQRQRQQRQSTVATGRKNDTSCFSPTHLAAIDAFTSHHLTTTRNAELRFRWYALSLRATGGGDRQLSRELGRFVCTQGRVAFVRPLFQDLCRAMGPVVAMKVFVQSQRVYHPLLVEMVERDLETAMAAAMVNDSSRSDADWDGTLARWLGIPEAYADYAPVAALALTVAVVGTAAVVVSRRHR